MRLTVLNVAYPLAPVGRNAVGGAEQVLTQLDYALTRAGHRSIVVATQGSVVAGILIPTPRWNGLLDEPTRQAAWVYHRRAISRALDEWPVDVVHLHGVDCYRYLPPVGVPALLTLHLPPQWYPPQIFHLDRPHTYLHCVSRPQRRSCPPCRALLPEIENGVADELFSTRHAKRRFALALGRICPEKGFHLALNAAKRAESPLLLAGEVFRYDAHEKYFQREIVPRLDAQRRFIGPAGWQRKLRLLSAARCLVAPSLAPETSSLVAREALACGTPVIAFPAGALSEVVEHGRTGFLVRNEREMAEAIRLADQLAPDHCRESARQRFGLRQMIDAYFGLYQRLAATGCEQIVRREVSLSAA